VGSSINAAGTVAGSAETPTGGQQAFVSTPGGALQPLSFPSASETYAYGVNGSGTVVGTSYINGQAHGTMWASSGATDLGAGVYAMGINNAGQVVGSNGHAFVFQNGQYQDLGIIPGGDWSAAYAINAAGTVVGDGSTASGAFRGIIWSPQGSMVLLGTFGGASSQATAVNNAGEVAGFASLPSGYQHAFTAVDAMLVDLGTLGGGSSYAYGINDSGQVVGYSWLSGGGDMHAFLYSNGVMQDLNALIAPGSGWELLAAYGINDSGQITGEGLFNGVPSVFVLNPADPPGASSVPEPSTAVVLACALVLANFGLRARLAYRQARGARPLLAGAAAKKPEPHPGRQTG